MFTLLLSPSVVPRLLPSLPTRRSSDLGAGRRMRAVMQNRDIAACLGVPTRAVDASTFGLGAGLAGIAGCALTLLGPIGPALGTYYIVDAFMVVVLGGVGQLTGTIAAAMLIGLANT